ncbi:MAG TPA: hypothetical protein VL354_18780 [Spirochaetia bacterium]|nr:hypothetical protein [Spirochaetia bacterium]
MKRKSFVFLMALLILCTGALIVASHEEEDPETQLRGTQSDKAGWMRKVRRLLTAN